jgi:hypothetical protein
MGDAVVVIILTLSKDMHGHGGPGKHIQSLYKYWHFFPEIVVIPK